MIELAKGHYGEVTTKTYDLWGPICVDFNPICANYTVGSGVVPDSRLADHVCRNLGYGSGYAIPLDPAFDIELSEVVHGSWCSKKG